MRLFSGAVARTVLAALAGITLAVVMTVGHDRAIAHEGHDHGDKPTAEGVLSSPRVVAVSESYQFVGIVEGEVLVVYLDRAVDNEPITTATVEVTLDGRSFKAEPQTNGTYEVTAPALKAPGQIEVLVNIADGDATDLLVGSLVIAANQAAAASSPGFWPRMLQLVTGGRSGQVMDGSGAGPRAAHGLLLAAGAIIVVAGFVGFRRWRRHTAAVLVCVALSAAVAATGHAHDGHDHGADVRASSGNSPQRRPDGTIFLPKPSQRLLEVRTSVLKQQTATRAVRLAGRVAANPNFSGVVQSTISGRYEAPASGLPPLGARVKAGDLLGRVTPSFASIDSSDMAQTLGDIEQKLSIARAKLARQEHLLRTNVVASALVDETRMEVDGLVKRRSDLLAARVRTEELHAPVDGVIAASRAVSGQVVASADKLFEIIDPTRVLIEALVFDQIDPDAVREATAVVPGEAGIDLRVLGRSRALQQQYVLMQFEVVGKAAPLSVGLPVTVIARAGAPVSGLFVPRAALAQAPNGQTVVFEHREPEVFVPRAVRTEPFDNETVLVTGGLEAGTKIVVRSAPLVNQVR
jgi:membrane fusion protein, heavy metal efflux system